MRQWLRPPPTPRSVCNHDVLPEARSALAHYHGRIERDYSRMFEELSRALVAQPNSVELLVPLGAVERRLGRYRDAARHFSRAAALDPRSGHTAVMAGLTYAFLRDYPESARYFDRAIILQPDWALPHAARAQLQVAWKGDTAGARRILRAATCGSPWPTFSGTWVYPDVAIRSVSRHRG